VGVLAEQFAQVDLAGVALSEILENFVLAIENWVRAPGGRLVALQLRFTGFVFLID